MLCKSSSSELAPEDEDNDEDDDDDEEESDDDDDDDDDDVVESSSDSGTMSKLSQELWNLAILMYFSADLLLSKEINNFAIFVAEAAIVPW